MTPLSPPSPDPVRPPMLDYKNPAPPDISRPINFICWFAILMTVAFVMWSNRSGPAVPGSPGHTNPTLPILGRYVIGTHAMLASGQKADPLAPLVAQLDETATSPEDKLRVVIVTGEVDEPAKVEKRLIALLAANPPPDVKHDAQTLATLYRDGPDRISTEDRQSLLNHYGWFGTAALTHGQPNDSPARAAMLSDAKRTFGVLLGAGSIGLAALLVGIVLIVLAIVLAAMGKIRMGYVPPAPDSVLLEGFTVYLIGFLGLSILLHLFISQFMPKTSSLGWTLLLTVVPFMAVRWPLRRGRPWAQVREAIGWHAGRGVFREVGAGLIGYVTALPLLAIMLLIAFALSKMAGVNPTHPIVGYVNKGPTQTILLYFIACIWAPVIEETMFRGALFSHLRARHRWFVSAPIVGFIFAAIHPQGWTLIPALGGIGVVLCALREWRGSIIAPMAAHALNNGAVLTLLMLAMG